ncbi:MAG: protease complex subunit PrcB family protein [Thermoanaerobacteraceae bacterium]|nr:protease complex subunit PrcB family protein [Thermoanaerobacteraceae bacterium]
MIRSVVVALLVVFLAGCSFADKGPTAESQGNDGMGQGGSITLPPGTADGEDKAPDIPVSSEGSSPAPVQTYPREVQDLIETMKTIEGGAWVAVGDETFIVVSRGMKPTAGYTVEIKEIVAEGDGAVASVSFKDPPEGSAVAEVITHPYAV